ncbi:uncharacterized protein CLUP02_08780 [Colletotrichum lupini]|uniref:Uncharacterized protein n=1 Tax=Colletotrichum lupini TaxID=145971 RepID=A0A9Q8WHB8_9PEZI|nr:uncharacterized protein CLUP02_08780 [Colletotrichum lupini]UQC83286.1 hypothetical protein CLUP02_08780 [Colletotrichum lupini]
MPFQAISSLPPGTSHPSSPPLPLHPALAAGPRFQLTYLHPSQPLLPPQHMRARNKRRPLGFSLEISLTCSHRSRPVPRRRPSPVKPIPPATVRPRPTNSWSPPSPLHLDDTNATLPQDPWYDTWLIQHVDQSKRKKRIDNVAVTPSFVRSRERARVPWRLCRRITDPPAVASCTFPHPGLHLLIDGQSLLTGTDIEFHFQGCRMIRSKPLYDDSTSDSDSNLHTPSPLPHGKRLSTSRYPA